MYKRSLLFAGAAFVALAGVAARADANNIISTSIFGKPLTFSDTCFTTAGNYVQSNCSGNHTWLSPVDVYYDGASRTVGWVVSGTVSYSAVLVHNWQGQYVGAWGSCPSGTTARQCTAVIPSPACYNYVCNTALVYTTLTNGAWVGAVTAY